MEHGADLTAEVATGQIKLSVVIYCFSVQRFMLSLSLLEGRPGIQMRKMKTWME